MQPQRFREWHDTIKAWADEVGNLLIEVFHYLALFVIGASIVWSAVFAYIGMMDQGQASIGDILLLFIYLELGAMVGIYFKTKRLPVRFLIYIAITALTRVLAVDAKTMEDQHMLILTGAILLLAVAVLVLRVGSDRFPGRETE